MHDYYITYSVPPINSSDSGIRNTTVTQIDAAHARSTLKKVIPNIIKIFSCIRIKK